MSFHIIGHAEILRFSEYGNFSVAPTEILDSKRDSVIVNNIFASFTLSSSTFQLYMSANDVGSPKSTSLSIPFHIGLTFCFFPVNLISSTYTDKNNPFPRCTNKHSHLETFSKSHPKKIFSRQFLRLISPTLIILTEFRDSYISRSPW